MVNDVQLESDGRIVKGALLADPAAQVHVSSNASLPFLFRFSNF
jgi:hypothetical protein